MADREDAGLDTGNASSATTRAESGPLAGTSLAEESYSGQREADCQSNATRFFKDQVSYVICGAAPPDRGRRPRRPVRSLTHLISIAEAGPGGPARTGGSAPHVTHGEKERHWITNQPDPEGTPANLPHVLSTTQDKLSGEGAGHIPVVRLVNLRNALPRGPYLGAGSTGQLPS